jgi:hypothetical protein
MDSVNAGGLRWRYRTKKKSIFIFLNPAGPCIDGSILPIMRDINHEEDQVSMIRKKKTGNLWRADYRFLNKFSTLI